jgi:hypothetical protein
LNAFLLSALIGVDVRDVKKFAAGLAWWKERIVDLKVDLEIIPIVAVSRKGCRIVCAISRQSEMLK